MLIIIIIAVFAMAIFIIFFTGKSADLFGQFGNVEPSTERDSCQIACNQAKINNDCEGWCTKATNTGTKCIDLGITCDIKTSEGTPCSACE